MLSPDDVRLLEAETSITPPKLVAVENTHNRGGGTVTPVKAGCDICCIARDRGLSTHLMAPEYLMRNGFGR